MHKISPIIFALFFTMNTIYPAISADELRARLNKSLKIIEQQEADRKVQEKIFNKELKAAEWQAHCHLTVCI